jgi:4-hydroxythreonine-4-phosphate dehydrogenase
MRKVIGITSGDPAGIGLEVVLKAIAPLLSEARWVLYTDPPAFERHHVRFCPAVKYRWIGSAAEASKDPLLHLIDVPGPGCPIPWGDVQPAAGARALAYLSAASDAALQGDLSAIVTAPVSKEAIGGAFRGHTEFLAERARAPRVAMAFFTPRFKVVLATVHMSLKNALASLTSTEYVALIRFASSELGRLGFRDLRIAVAGINPHAGESGMFGREEEDILRPAVQTCQSEGLRVSGPHPADSLYYRAQSGEFDVVIAPYHDQGLIPVKLIAHGESANVTLGLPYIRTSPDHGTAFDIAGKGIADPFGMRAALRQALELTQAVSRQ